MNNGGLSMFLTFCFLFHFKSEDNMTFADVHIHALYGVDDGPKDMESMCEIVDASYGDGVRYMCLTPHYHPGYYGNNGEKAKAAYEKLKGYCAEKYPDLKLMLGNELHYERGCINWLAAGACNMMGDTHFVLVDFSDGEKKDVITKMLDRLLNAGYTPILAHAERYGSLSLGLIDEYRQNGVIVQMDAQSVFGGFGFWVKRFANKLLAARLVDIVSTDAHNVSSRPPQMSKCYEYIKKKCSERYADSLCFERARDVIFGGN